jgi:hypothetical protein
MAALARLGLFFALFVAISCDFVPEDQDIVKAKVESCSG